jgi:pimeloyl-ACP methyl ester carboxylesterase
MKFKAYSLIIIVPAILLGLVACFQGVGNDVVDEMVNIGSHSLHIYCIGEGSPPVVIDVGFGDSYTNWHTVQEGATQDTQVCAYERAGYGSSQPGPMPRSSQQVADELRLLLEKADIPGPYVLVGHSLGGLNMQVFVSQYPDLVAGAVLLDPPPPGFITGERFLELYQMAEGETAGLLAAAEQARQAADPEEKAKASFYETLASEHAMMMAESAQQVAAIESFGDMPLIVLASGKPNPAFGDSAEAFQQFWIEQNQALATKSANGTFILAEESGHNLHLDAPDVVLDAIRQVSQ